MKIVVDDIGAVGAKPLYDVSIGNVNLVATPKGDKEVVSKKKNQLMVPLFPVTPELLRSMASVMERALDEGRWSGVMTVDTKKNKVGLMFN